MAIPNWFVNGQRHVNPPGGVKLCELDPPFTQHATLEVLVHCPLAEVEIRHLSAVNETKQVVFATNRDTIYLTVEPGDRLEMHWMATVTLSYVQGSLYAWR